MSGSGDRPADRVALIDLDATIADYPAALREEMAKLAAPNEPPFSDRLTGGQEPAYIEARRKLIQAKPGFWRGLRRLLHGFEIVDELRRIGFNLHVLTKGPQSQPGAWGEKLEWCREHISDAVVTVTGDKSLVYGRVLVDDYAPYFQAWLRSRPRGLVVCVAQPWNAGYQAGGSLEHHQVLRYDGAKSRREEMCLRLQAAFDRNTGEGA